MLKEVGVGGQILLGKEYAGRLFDVRELAGGRVELVPVEGRVLASEGAERDLAASSEAWLPPGGYGSASRWAIENKAALTDYADRVETEGTAAEQLQAFLEHGAGTSQKA